jgi:hypothetical protein
MRCEPRDRDIDRATTTIQRADILPVPIVGDTGAALGQQSQAEAPTIERKIVDPDSHTATGNKIVLSGENRDGKGSESEIVTLTGTALHNLKQGMTSNNGAENNDMANATFSSQNDEEEENNRQNKEQTQSPSASKHKLSRSGEEDRKIGRTSEKTALPREVSKAKLRKLAARENHFKLF